jgi:hypothetical protein
MELQMQQVELLNSNPSMLQMESPRRVKGLDSIVAERKKDTSILLDKEERELVKRGPEVTKEEMW